MSLISAEDARQRNNELLRSHAALGEMLKQIEHEILKSTNSNKIENFDSVESLLAPIPPPMSEQLRSHSINRTGTVSPLDNTKQGTGGRNGSRTDSSFEKPVEVVKTMAPVEAVKTMKPLQHAIQILESESESDSASLHLSSKRISKRHSVAEIDQVKSSTIPLSVKTRESIESTNAPSISSTVNGSTRKSFIATSVRDRSNSHISNASSQKSAKSQKSQRSDKSPKSEKYPPTDYSPTEKQSADIDVTAQSLKPTLKQSDKTFDFDLSSNSDAESDWRANNNPSLVKRKSTNLFGSSFNALDDDDSFTYD